MKWLHKLLGFFRKKKPKAIHPTDLSECPHAEVIKKITTREEKKTKEIAKDIKEKLALKRWREQFAKRSTSSERRMYVPGSKPGQQIIARGYGKHMAGKGSKSQLPGYRKAVKERKEPEND